MSREKQIEEMASSICSEYDCVIPCQSCAYYGYANCRNVKSAEKLYNAGYRKASEVEKEIEDWKAMTEQYQRQFEDCYEEKAKIASEVAREIFEKIGKVIHHWGALAEQDNSDYGELAELILTDITASIAELKKKYTEEGK